MTRRGGGNQGLAGRTSQESRWSSQDPAPCTHPGATSATAEPRASPAAKGKEKARGEQEEKAGGCQEPGARSSPSPAVPQPGSGAGRTRRALCGAGTRARGRGGPQRPPPGTDRPLFPRTKGTAARGGWRMPGHGEPPRPRPPGLSTGPLSHAGLGCGRCLRGCGAGARHGGEAEHGRQRKSCEGNRQEGKTRRVWGRGGFAV